ncbi:MAG: hypothetical protein OES13_01670 [Acidimicrobiia bacterium]|nr:hypothetical protein [Acidimicrobiia bacterium]
MATTTAQRPETYVPEATPAVNWLRRGMAITAIAIGVVFIAVTLIQNLFSVGPAFEELIDDFRPVLQDAALAQADGDVAALGAVGDEMQTAVIPGIAQALSMTPEDFGAFMGSEFPAVATGVAALPEIVPTFQGLIGTLGEQQALFFSADEIPTEDLPATTVPWGLLFAGIAVVAVGIVMLRSSKLGAYLAIGLGLLLVVVPLVLTLPTKSSDADELNANLDPIYTPELVQGAEGALGVVGAMGAEMQTAMLPALGQQLGMTGDELNAFMGANFPATAGALQELPATMERFEGLTTVFADNLDNYDTIKPVSFAPIIWMVIIGGGVLFVLGAWTAVDATRRRFI